MNRKNFLKSSVLGFNAVTFVPVKLLTNPLSGPELVKEFVCAGIKILNGSNKCLTSIPI